MIHFVLNITLFFSYLQSIDDVISSTLYSLRTQSHNRKYQSPVPVKLLNRLSIFIVHTNYLNSILIPFPSLGSEEETQ